MQEAKGTGKEMNIAEGKKAKKQCMVLKILWGNSVCGMGLGSLEFEKKKGRRCPSRTRKRGRLQAQGRGEDPKEKMVFPIWELTGKALYFKGTGQKRKDGGKLKFKHQVRSR